MSDRVQKQDFCKVGYRPTFLTLGAYHVFRCKSELSIKTHIFLSDIMSLRMKMLFSFTATCPSKAIFHNSFHRTCLDFSHRRLADWFHRRHSWIICAWTSCQPVRGSEEKRFILPFQQQLFGLTYCKHRKNCECCPGHHLIVNHYSSMSWKSLKSLINVSQ